MLCSVDFFQEPYNQVEYAIVGDDKARSYFSIDPTSGSITLARSVNEDNDVVYTVSLCTWCVC